MAIQILIADDHAVFRSGLRSLMEKEDDLVVIGEAADGTEVLETLASQKVDVLVLDISMPKMQGWQVAEEVIKENPNTAIVVLTMHDDERYIEEMFNIGVQGYVLKKSTDTDLLQAIRAVHEGKKYVDPNIANLVISSYIGKSKSTGGDSGSTLGNLTPRELEVLKQLAHGFTNSEIAEQLQISNRTVETHRKNIMEKLGATGRAELVRFALKHGLLVLE